MMTYEDQYMTNLDNILNHGILEKNERTGISTYRLPSTQIVVDLEEEFPILRTKKVNWKTAVDEILWIMQKQSNKTSELRSHIWDAWTGEDGTIGKSYGYQVGQHVYRNNVLYANQVDYVLKSLAADKSSRQCVIDLWNVKELDDMNLVPCVYSSIWTIINGRLNCMVVQRSADYPVGVPFDTTQYAVLVHLFARHLGVRPGILTHVMADSHIYENQVEGVKEQLNRWKTGKYPRYNMARFMSFGSKNFWEVKLSDIEILSYMSEGPIKYEVAV